MRRLSTAAAATLATVVTVDAVAAVTITNFTIQFLIKVVINQIFGHFSKLVILVLLVAPRVIREAITKRWCFISRIPFISRVYSVRIHLDRVT